MADLSDVETALVALCAAAAYPAGIASPSACGVPVKAYRGWPSADALNADMAAGTANISVFPISGMTRLTTRFQRDWLADGPPATTLTATATPTTVTLAGQLGVPQLVGVRSRSRAYVYQATAADTPSTVAAALAALVPGASAAGPVVTVPYDIRTLARVSGYATVRRELRRQTQGVRLTVWAPSRAARDAVATAVDQAVAVTDFLQLPDGQARLLFAASDVDDVPTKDKIWKRDLRVTVDYATTQNQVVPGMLWGVVQENQNSTELPDAIG